MGNFASEVSGMSQLLIKLNDDQKIKILSDFLASLPFVSSVKVTEDEDLDKGNEDGFFAAAGMWQGRNITQQSIRDKAWRQDK